MYQDYTMYCEYISGLRDHVPGLDHVLQIYFQFESSLIDSA